MDFIGNSLPKEGGMSGSKKLYVAKGSSEISPRRGASIIEVFHGTQVTNIATFTVSK